MEIENSMSEMEFYAENRLITIKPNFSGEEMQLISGTFGPFRPAVAIEVPIWLAIHLKKQQKCTIIPPPWMDMEVLRAKVEEERKTSEFTEIEYHYMEIAQLLIAHAKDDIKNKSIISRLLQDFFNIRTSKIEKSLLNLSYESYAINLTNIGAIEIQTLRKLLVSTYTSVAQIRSYETN
jgi:GINS complex subunit 2